MSSGYYLTTSNGVVSWIQFGKNTGDCTTIIVKQDMNGTVITEKIKG